MNWEDLIAETSGPALDPQIWACDCQTKKVKGRGQNFSGRMFKTRVDLEGICLKCGHYALLISKRMLNLNKQRASGLKYRMKL